jgi:sugar lactone lactonase YvrE
MEYREIGTIAGRGNAPGQFRQALRGITIGPDDRLYAVGDQCVKVFDAAGKFERRWKTASAGQCIAVDPSGHVFVGSDGRIEIYKRDATPLDVWDLSEQLGRVTAIGFANTDVLVADATNRCIRRYDADGKFLNDIGHHPHQRTFLIPNGVLDFTVDKHGIIHAANPGKHRVEQYKPGGEKLGHIGRFDGRDPAGFAGCCNPTNVTVASDGRIYVTEKAAPRAKVYDRDGNLLSIVADQGFDLSCKNMDLAVDSRGRVYVVDTVRLHIRVFEPIEKPSSSADKPQTTPAAHAGDRP